MTREDKDSLVEMLAKIPVTETKGSLLSAIGKLLRVIDISENSIMIPTLLKDKCEFDAYEMLTLAKILKASILGHNDLVEFYLSESSSQFPNESLALHHHQQQQQQQQHQLMLSNQPHTTIQQSSINNNNNNVLGGGGGGGGGGASAGGGVGRNHRYHYSNTSSSSGHYSQSHSPNTHLVASSLSHHLANPIHQLSATPSLRSSVSDSASSSTPSTPLPNLAESIGSSSGSGGSNGASGRCVGSGNGGNCTNGGLSKNQLQRLQLGSNGDPDATVSLLLQIEHLKVFIPHVTSIFESIVELYKNSVDTFGR